MFRSTLFFVAAAAGACCCVQAEDSRVFEMRTYYANEGKLDALQARFRDHTVALFEKHGMTNVGYFVPAEGESEMLVYMLAYPDQKAREESWKAFLNDEDWKAAYKASVRDGKLVRKIDSVFLKATDYSPKIQASKTDSDRLFELRTYTTRPGRLDALNARFRDHTVKLFEKHGLTNIAYWVPINEKDGSKNKLIYLLAHQDEASRNSGFKAFGQDPAWQTARKASEEDGPILIPKGVQKQYLKPTDFSTLR